MGITRSVNTANDPKLGPVFSFKTYERSQAPFYNNNRQIDFVTWGGNLYVCVEDNVSFKAGNPADNGFLLLIKKGADGRPGAPGAPGKPGPMPEYSLKFDGKQLVVIDQNGVRKAVSPELTGPSWFPELQGHTIIWKRKGAEDTSIPQNIDLDELRPIEECPILLRLNSDNTKREAEKTGPGYYIQWKREGAEEWTNLMSISELMNIALAGVCFWWDDAKDGSTDIEGNPVQTLHFGHRQVVEATYDASKLGNKRIADVTLGDVLFDAGEIPFANYDADIAALNAYLHDLQDDLETTKASIPTKLSQLINDVPYIKTINGHLPNTSGELKLKKVDNIDLVGEGNIPFATINGRPIVNTDANFEIPSDYLTEGQLKTVGGQSLIKTPGQTDILLRTINGESIIGSSPLYVGTVKSVSVNGGTHVTPDSSGNVNLTVSGGSGSGDGVGIDDLEFRLNGNTLQYRVRENGSWGSWTNISLPSGASSSGEHVDLRISNNVLQIRYDGGSWQDVGVVNSGSGGGNTINGFISVTRDGNTLIFTKQNGTTQSVTIPTSGDGTSVTIQQILGSGTKIATITINGVPTDIYAPSGDGGSGSGGGSGDGGTIVTYNTFMVYQRTDSPSVAPSTNTITAAIWDTSTNELDLTSQYWTNHPGNATGANDACLWMTSATFRSDTGARVGNWSDPVCLTSRFGDGSDSQLKEFIYRSVTAIEYSAVIVVRPVKAIDDNRDDNYPASDNLAVRQWVDSPVGITTEYPYELCSYRRKVDGVWSEYSMPFIWSRWGEDGVDGDGVEYVFRTATIGDVEESNGSIVLKQSVSRPNNSWAYNSPVAPWTDDPSGVNASYPYEFCSLRKTTIVNNAKVWGSWSEPALWSNYVSVDANVDYTEIENAVEARIGERMTALTNRIDAIDGSWADVNVTSADSLVEILADYEDNNQKSFAEIIVDGKGAEIASAAGLATSTQLTGVTSRLSAVEGSITNAVDQQTLDGAIESAEQRMTANLISQTVTAANSKWHKVVNNVDTYQAYSPGQNETVAEYNARMINNGWDLVVMADKLSAIEQQADKISILVGSNGEVDASVIVDAINDDSNVTISADRINLNGYVTATQLQTGSITIPADSIGTGTIGPQGGINITSNGVTLGSNCTIGWGQVDTDDVKIGYNELDSNLQGMIDSGGGLTQEQVEQIVQNGTSTFITETDLATTNVYAQNLEVGAANIHDLTLNQITLGNNDPIDDWSDLADMVTCNGGLNIYIGDPDDAPNDSLVFNY